MGIIYFVIYESNRTFTGKEKPLYFTRALFETNRYEKFQDKLIPFPSEITINENIGRGYAFPREHIARRTLIEKGLRVVHARHGDLFMHNDLDELLKPHILSRLKKCGGWEYLQAGIGGGPLSFKEEDQNKNNKVVESYFINGDKYIAFNETDNVNKVVYIGCMTNVFQSSYNSSPLTQRIQHLAQVANGQGTPIDMLAHNAEQ